MCFVPLNTTNDDDRIECWNEDSPGPSSTSVVSGRRRADDVEKCLRHPIRVCNWVWVCVWIGRLTVDTHWK